MAKRLNFITEIAISPSYVLSQCTEVRFASFFSGWFTTMAVMNPMERKPAKRTSVQLFVFVWRKVKTSLPHQSYSNPNSYQNPAQMPNGTLFQQDFLVAAVWDNNNDWCTLAGWSKLYIPRTINIWKKLLSTAICADKNGQVSGKGQLISKANFKVFIRTKKPTKIFLFFWPSQNDGEFMKLVFRNNHKIAGITN